MQALLKILRNPTTLTAIVVVLAALGVSIVITTGDNGQVKTITIGLPSKAPAGADKPIPQITPGNRSDGTPLRDEAPAGTKVATSPDAQQRAINGSQTAAANTTTGPDVVPENRTLASPHQRGCLTRTVRNYSSRNGARPALLVAHLTVSPNHPGWGDVDSVVNLFDNPRAQASSNYVVDNEGHCKLIVPETAKAWTQAFYNPWSISIEEINTGRESTYAGTKGLARIGLIFSDAGRRWGIPLRHGKVNNCRVVRAGIVQHAELGACGGGHVDISGYSLTQVVRAARQARCAHRKHPRHCLRHLG